MNKVLAAVFVLVLATTIPVLFGADANRPAAKQPGAEEKALWDKINSTKGEIDKFAAEKSPQRPSPDANEAEVNRIIKEFEAFRKEISKRITPLNDLAKEYRRKYPAGAYAQENTDLLLILMANNANFNNGILSSEDDKLYEQLWKDKELTAQSATELFWINLIRIRNMIENPKEVNKPDKKAIEALLDRTEFQITDVGKRFPFQGYILDGEITAADLIEKMYPERAVRILKAAKQYTPPQMANILDGFIRNKSILGTKPELKFKAVDGREVDLAKLKGKVVLIEFWATWCPRCVYEMPIVIDVYKKFKDRDFEIIGIALEKGDIEALKKYVKANGITWPQYADGKEGDTYWAQYYGVISTPAMWLVDREGKVVDKFVEAQELSDKVAKLLGIVK